MNISFTIVDKEYKIPESISILKFQSCSQWDLEDYKNLRPFVAMMTDCPLSDLNLLEEEVFGFIAVSAMSKLDVQSSKLHQTINGYKLKRFDSLTFGEWIDLDIFYSTGHLNNLVNIISILYGAPSEVVESWDIKKVWASIVECHNWRNIIYREYDEFFEISEASDDSEPSESNIQLMWYEVIMTLTSEDFTKIEYVINRPYREALNYLTWKKSKIQKQKLEQLKQRNDLSRRFK